MRYPIVVGLRSTRRYSIKAGQSIGVPTHQEDQSSSLRIGLGPSLLPFFQRSLVDAQLAREYCTRATQFLASVPNDFGIHLGQRRDLDLVAAQRELAFAMLLHFRHAFHHFRRNPSLSHYFINFKY